MVTAGDTIHATCVAFGDIGILLRGPSGAGKSDLALRLIEAGADLVADDRVRLMTAQGGLRAAPPDELAGLLEVRGIGPVRLPNVSGVSICLVADLVRSGMPERLPADDWVECSGVCIRRVDVAPFEQTAVAKLRIAAYDASGRTDPVTGARRHDGGRHEKDRPVNDRDAG
ncbi:MAG: HPr kinase/phosphorylase [Paracoccaceae bacterium]|jgi:HPr kinase/phosphorylase